MGRTHRKGPADPLADELRWYFCNAESDLGVQSSFGAFVDMAMSGIQPGGRSNGAERRAATIASRLDRPGQRHREMRRRMQALGEREPLLVQALFAAYGPTDWGRVADAAFGRGTGERLAKALGPNQIGVALLTERLAKVHAEWLTAPGARPPTPGMVLRAMVVVAYPNQLPKSSAQRAAQLEALRRVCAVRDEATMLLERARAAMPPREVQKRRSTPRADGGAFVPPALRPRSRPVLAYDAFAPMPGAASEALLG